jgi:hypothetical protein
VVWHLSKHYYVQEGMSSQLVSLSKHFVQDSHMSNQLVSHLSKHYVQEGTRNLEK